MCGKVSSVSSLTVWVTSSRVTWLSPGSSWVTVLNAGRGKSIWLRLQNITDYVYMFWTSGVGWITNFKMLWTEFKICLLIRDDTLLNTFVEMRGPLLLNKIQVTHFKALLNSICNSVDPLMWYNKSIKLKLCYKPTSWSGWSLFSRRTVLVGS